MCLLALAIAAAFLVGLGDVEASFPALGALEGLAVPMGLIAPLIVVVVVGWGLASGDRKLEAVAARSIRGRDIAFVCGWALAAALVCGAIEALGLNGHGIAAARNAIGFAGLLFVGRRLGGGAIGPLIPAVFVVFAAAFGGDFEGRPRWWAWLVADGIDPFSWALVSGTALVGIVISLGGTHPLDGHS